MMWGGEGGVEVLPSPHSQASILVSVSPVSPWLGTQAVVLHVPAATGSELQGSARCRSPRRRTTAGPAGLVQGAPRPPAPQQPSPPLWFGWFVHS